MNLTWHDVFNKKVIKDRAKENWECKTDALKLKSGKKYEHIFVKLNKPYVEWTNSFDDLTPLQQKILIKGEIIRTYDGLPNIDKTYIKLHFKLSRFESKWFKLSSDDKKKILHTFFT